MSYLCFFAYNGVQHILCYVFVLFDFVMCLVYTMFPVSPLSIFDCPVGIL